MGKYQWQGEPVKIKYGSCIVKENKEKPLFWYNYECYPDGLACVPCIEVTTKDGYTFMIANHFGIGIHKLINGGWPSHQHFSVEGKFSTKPQLRYSEFDLESFEEHEAARNNWQKKHYPKEWEKKQALLKMIVRR